MPTLHSGKLSDREEIAMHVKNLLAVLAAAVFIPESGTGQVGTGTDIYLVSIRISADGVRLGEPSNITDRDGYDNQPSFLPETCSR